MILTLEISPEVERELTRAAATSGRGLSEWVLETARDKAGIETAPAASTEDETEARRLAAIERACGMFAGDDRTVDDFLADRHAEGEAEYDKWIASQNRGAARENGGVS